MASIELNAEMVYHRVAMLFFSTLSLFVLTVSVTYSKDIIYSFYLNQILLIIFVFGYFFLLIDFLVYYISRALGIVRESYPKHKWAYGFVLFIIASIIVFAIWYYIIGISEILNNLAAVFITAVAIGWWKYGNEIFDKISKMPLSKK